MHYRNRKQSNDVALLLPHAHAHIANKKRTQGPASPPSRNRCSLAAAHSSEGKSQTMMNTHLLQYHPQRSFNTQLKQRIHKVAAERLSLKPNQNSGICIEPHLLATRLRIATHAARTTRSFSRCAIKHLHFNHTRHTSHLVMKCTQTVDNNALSECR